MIRRNIAILCLLRTCVFAHAQEHSVSEQLWKKTVSRTIDFPKKGGAASHRAADAKQDTSLLVMIVNAIKTADVAAYAGYDASFSTKLTLKDLDEVINGKFDSIPMGHWVTNMNITPVPHRDFSYDSIHKYQILEEWTVNPHTGKTEIQITGIAPVRDIYGDDGAVYRGSQAMFWVKYNDVHPILARYEQTHPNHTISSLIWDDYFLSDEKPEVK